jgi:multidrug efflux pump
LRSACARHELAAGAAISADAERGHHREHNLLRRRSRRHRRLHHDAARERHLNWLHGSLDYIPVTAVFALLVLSSIYFLYSSAKSELAPQEDQGVVVASSTLAPDATLEQKVLYAQQVYQIMRGFPETEHVFQINSPATVVGGMVLKPWDARARTSNALQPLAQQKFDQVAGARIAAFQLPPLPGSQGLPIQFVIKTTDPFDRLDDASQQFLKAAIASGLFIFLDTDLKIDNPEAVVEIDRDKASQLGLKMSDVGTAMGSMLGGGYVNYFSLDQRSYKVIPQVERRYRLNTDQLLNYYVANVSGTPVPLSTIAKISTKTVPETLNHFQQLNSATIQGVAAPGVAQSDALDFLNDSPPGRCRAATASITAHCPGNTSRSRRASWRRSASPW